MKQPALILLGLVTLWPLAYFVIFVVKAVELAVEVMNSPSLDPGKVLADFTTMIIMGGVTTLVSIALMVIYIMHANKNESLDQSGRFLWTLLFILLGAVTMPVYYVLQIHPWAPDEPPATE